MAGRLECFVSLYLIVTIMALPSVEKKRTMQDFSFAKDKDKESTSRMAFHDFRGNFDANADASFISPIGKSTAMQNASKLNATIKFGRPIIMNQMMNDSRMDDVAAAVMAKLPYLMTREEGKPHDWENIRGGSGDDSDREMNKVEIDKRSIHDDHHHRAFNFHKHHHHHKRKGRKYKTNFHKYKVRNKPYYGRYKTNMTDDDDSGELKLRHSAHAKYGRYTSESMDSLLEHPFRSHHHVASAGKSETSWPSFRSSFRNSHSFHSSADGSNADDHHQSFRNKLQELRWLGLMQRQKQQKGEGGGGLWLQTNEIGESWMGGRPKPTPPPPAAGPSVSRDEHVKMLASNTWTDTKSEWPRFTYHRVTSSPIPYAGSRLSKRQRSAYVAVSLISTNTSRNPKSVIAPTQYNETDAVSKDTTMTGMQSS